jgi:hypothetical protein
MDLVSGIDACLGGSTASSSYEHTTIGRVLDAWEQSPLIVFDNGDF